MKHVSIWNNYLHEEMKSLTETA